MGRGPDQRKRKPRAGAIRGSEAEPRVRECLENGGTLAEASRIVADNTGYFPNKSVMSRYWQSVRAEAEEVRRLGVMLASVGYFEEEYPGCEVADLARKLFMVRAVEALRHMPEGALEKVPPEQLSLIISRLDHAGAAVDRNRLEARRRMASGPSERAPYDAEARFRALNRAMEEIIRDLQKAEGEPSAGDGTASPPETPPSAPPASRGG